MKVKIIFICLLLFFFISSFVFAQTPQNFDVTVSPTFYDLTGKPDTKANQVIKIRNNTLQKITLIAQIKKMGADETGDLTIKDDDDGSISWIELKDKKIIIPPREWESIPITISVPKSAAFGYYWAVSFTQDSSVKQTNTGAKVNASIVVPILLNVTKEGAMTRGILKSFTTDSFFYEYLPAVFKTTFSNSGNVHIRPRGNIFIKDFLGRQVAILDVNNSGGIVLPNIVKSFENSWKDSFIWYEEKVVDGQVLLDKNGKSKKELKIDFKKILDLRIGKYSATAVLLVSGEQRDFTYEATTSFVVLPWKIIGAIIAFIMFLIYREIQVRKLRREIKELRKTQI